MAQAKTEAPDPREAGGGWIWMNDLLDQYNRTSNPDRRKWLWFEMQNQARIIKKLDSSP